MKFNLIFVFICLLMNPLKQFKYYFIGDILSKTDDVFEKAKVEVLFSFTLFFLVSNIPYAITSFSLSFLHIVLGTTSVIALICVLIILRKTKNVTGAIYFYIFNHTVQNIAHFLMSNGVLKMTGILFFLLYILFGFLMLGRKWGIALTLLVLFGFFVGTYNELSNFSLFHFPPEYTDPQDMPLMRYFTIVPILLNTFLISKFVKARSEAEVQIKNQKIKLESKNKDITDSINYARKIQHAVLPQEENIYRNIPLSFIVYKPRDIVSGDFFWFHEVDKDNYFMVCADCTGHGVPGAFMTVIGTTLLNQIIIENKLMSPSAILTELDKKINITLKQEQEGSISVQDGMDLSLIKVDKAQKEFIFTSAKRPAIFIRNREMQEFKGSKASLGGMRMGEKQFEEIKIKFLKDDIIYVFTDGYPDQFGGEKGKKYSSRRLKETLLDIHQCSMPEQKQKLESTIDNWKGTLEQVDDISIMGIRF